MEYLPGRSLKQLIRQEAPIDPVRAIDITLQILKAARFAHRRGVIHRDLKPHNVIVDDSDHAKVTDFGIARAGASDMTETGSIMGTAQYLSPEQAQGHAVSAGSDLYSVGVVLYELLTGRVPFDGEAAVTIALKHVSESPTPPERDQSRRAARARAGRPVGAEQEPRRPASRRRSIRRRARAGQGGDPRAVQRPAYGEHGGAGGGRRAACGDGRGRARAALCAGVPPADCRQRSPMAPGSDAVQPPAPPAPRRPRRRWPWVLVLVLLLVAGGGAAAYLLTRPVQEVVPTVVGEQLNLAQAQIQNAGLAVSVINLTNPKQAGTVIAPETRWAGRRSSRGRRSR